MAGRPSPTPASLPVLAGDDLAERLRQLDDAGIGIVRGTFVDSAGVLRAKQVTLGRAGVFASPGLGAAPAWAVFCADDAIAFTPSFTPVGDLRLRLDLDAVRLTSPGHAWGPVELADQHGTPLGFCPRGALRRQQAAAEQAGLEVRAAIELEFICFDGPTGEVAGGTAYGLRPLLEHEALLDELHASLDHAGLDVEQLHAEYGTGQFELSLAPLDPLGAADANVLARLLVSAVARRHGWWASFSPQALAQGIGNGAHLHLSIERDGRPLLSGGTGPRGLTEDGEAVVAGLLAGLPEAMGALAPSVLSPLRLQPGHWSGAFCCWGLENREAAVRLCAATPGNPRGANLEVKCVDPSANPYVAVATLVGLARAGLREPRPAPPETAVDPQQIPEEERLDRGIVPIGRDQAAALDALESSAAMADILGPELIEALVAVRRHEVELAKGTPTPELIDRLRFAWSA